MIYPDQKNYLIHLSYLGFRYHGWLKQPGVKTVQGVLEKAIAHILKKEKFKILGASKTDAGVSANNSAFQLISTAHLDKDFIQATNEILPGDIFLKEITVCTPAFNIIRATKSKEYHFLFCLDSKPHPFSAPLLGHFEGPLEVDTMKDMAMEYEGVHDFVNYGKPKEGINTKREIFKSCILNNQIYSSGFFPEHSYIFQVEGSGFLRYQVREMMGQLILLGSGKINKKEFQTTLNGGEKEMPFIAPSLGLILHKVNFDYS